MSVFVGGHLNVERAEVRQEPEHSGYEQLKGKEHPITVSLKSSERFLTSAHLAAGAFAREGRSRTAH